MASVTKATSGNVTTFTITDASANQGTLTVTVDPVLGPTVQMGGAALLRDGVGMVSELLLQLRTGLIPGAGAQGLQP